MIKSFLSIVFRSMRKNLFYTLITIGGLTIGIASVSMIALYVEHEISYDKFQASISNRWCVFEAFKNN